MVVVAGVAVEEEVDHVEVVIEEVAEVTVALEVLRKYQINVLVGC